MPTPKQPEQLQNIKAHLDLILLAIEALTGISSDAMLQAAAALQLTIASDRVNLWRLRQASPLRKGSGGRKKLDVEEARALVILCCHLAQQHQRQVRLAVARLEELAEQGRPYHEAAIIGDYLDGFCNAYEERMQAVASVPTAELTDLALKLLLDLLFYSGVDGPRRLWLALMDRSLANHSLDHQ
ncbi:MAG: DUF3038 domain-containing protein [Cyanobacteria bacterium P01_H01_bin.121]